MNGLYRWLGEHCRNIKYNVTDELNLVSYLAVTLPLSFSRPQWTGRRLYTVYVQHKQLNSGVASQEFLTAGAVLALGRWGGSKGVTMILAEGPMSAVCSCHVHCTDSNGNFCEPKWGWPLPSEVVLGGGLGLQVGQFSGHDSSWWGLCRGGVLVSSTLY